VVTYYKTALDGVDAAPERIRQRRYMPFSEVYNNYTNYYNDVTGDSNGNLSWTLPAEVPYKFCSDEFASYSSNVTCKPYDKGANYREVVQDRMERYNQYYAFTNFKRDRFNFAEGAGLNNYLSRLVDRFFGPLSSIYRYYLFAFSSLGTDNSGNTL